MPESDMHVEAAENFCEEDEDPEEVFAWFDAGPHGMTAPPGPRAGEGDDDA
jgi:hypothetical protein